MVTLGHVTIVANGVKKESLSVLKEITDYLDGKGIRHLEILTYESTEDFTVPYDTDLVISLGGDGTVLSVARKVHEMGHVILPVNLGTFGYITEISKDEWKEEIENYINGKAVISRRLMLRVAVKRKGRQVFSSYALNEATISSSGISKVVKLELYLDKTKAGIFKADGLIVATPTGSTGYSLAAGGPILSSEISAFIITPICAFTLSNRPLVTDSSSHVSIKVMPGQRTDVVLTVDGQISFVLVEEDEIEIEKSRSRTILLSSNRRNYMEVIRDKLNWLGEMHA